MLGVNYVLYQYLMHITAVAVNCYVLITGYFLIDKYTFRWKSLLRTWLQVLFYSVIIYIIMVYCGRAEFRWKLFIGQFIPIWSGYYWFFTKYAALILLAPFLARLAKSLTQKEYKQLLTVLFVLNITLVRNLFYGHLLSNGFSLMWFVFLFMVAGYIRLYNPGMRWHRNYGRLFLGFCFLLLIGNIFKQTWGIYQGESYYLYGVVYNDFTFVSSILLFLWAKYTTFSERRLSRFLVRIAPYTFGVYLIHDNGFVRNLLWKQWLPWKDYFSESWFMVIVIAVPITIFLLCILIDFGRSLVFRFCKIEYYIEYF